ncbi:hypothetical protein IJ182_08665 [bacterium]|nr:hypothetical protein [bacterium]
MKKILLLILCVFLSNNISFAYNYSEEDKNMFYDSFIEGYIEQMTNSINNLAIDQNKKDTFIKEFVKLINRNELIDSSWSCIQKYPVNDIVSASITCTSNWTTQQTEKNKKLFESIK